MDRRADGSNELMVEQMLLNRDGPADTDFSSCCRLEVRSRDVGIAVRLSMAAACVWVVRRLEALGERDKEPGSN